MAISAKFAAIGFIPIIVIGLAFGAYVGISVGSSTSVSSISSVATTSSNTSSHGQNGLQLELGVSRTSLLPGESLSITVAEYNTLDSANNVSSGSNWSISDLELGSCGHTVYPFGIAIFSGVYTASNVSEGTPLQIFPADVPCPLFIMLITGYIFQPLNDSAILLPSDTTPLLMSSQVSVSAIYSGGTQHSFPAGEYTVVAGDEWGVLAFQYFSVV